MLNKIIVSFLWFIGPIWLLLLCLAILLVSPHIGQGKGKYMIGQYSRKFY